MPTDPYLDRKKRFGTFLGLLAVFGYLLCLRPFVSAAGQWISITRAEAALESDDTYLAFVPNNYDPSQKPTMTATYTSTPTHTPTSTATPTHTPTITTTPEGEIQPGHYVGSNSVSFDVTQDLRVCNYTIRVRLPTAYCRITPVQCAEIDATNSFLFSASESGAIFKITGVFDGPTHVTGDYSVTWCGSVLVTPPVTGEWDASIE